MVFQISKGGGSVMKQVVYRSRKRKRVSEKLGLFK